MSRSAVLRCGIVLSIASIALAACGSSNSDGSGASGSSSATPANPLIIGTLLPQTGSLDFLGPPEVAGVDAAIADINSAGGVLGQPLQKIDGDSGDATTTIAAQTVDAQIKQGVSAIIGAAQSAVSLSVIKTTTAAGVVLFSPANTSSELSDTAITKGLYFRTVAPDTFQGAVLAALAQADGAKNVAIMALTDVYTTGLADDVTKNFEVAGGTVAVRVNYDPTPASYTAGVAKVKAADPDALILIGFSESKGVIQQLQAQGIGPQKLTLFLCDGQMSNALAVGLPSGLMNGVKGTIPGVQASEKLRAQMLATNPNLTDFAYGPESYDATVLVALAAEAAQSTKGADIAAQIPAVSAQGNEPCSKFAECVALLKAGQAISYVGPSGATGIKANGDPSYATMTIWQFGPDNTIAPIDSIAADVPTS